MSSAGVQSVEISAEPIVVKPDTGDMPLTLPSIAALPVGAEYNVSRGGSSASIWRGNDSVLHLRLSSTGSVQTGSKIKLLSSMQHEMQAEEVHPDDDGDGFPWQILMVIVFALPCLLLIVFILKKKTKGNGT